MTPSLRLIWSPRCLQFGLDNTALALLEHGVEGCRLEWKDLDRFARKSWSWGHYGYVRCACPSGSWQTCDGCSWGFGRENDVWMPDWDEPLEDAKATALDIAEMPFTEALFTAIRSDNCLPGLEVADEVWARLLDIAVLLGDKDLASQCAPRCPWKPLRRWRARDPWGPNEPYNCGQIPYTMIFPKT